MCHQLEGLLILSGILRGVGRRIFALQQVEFKMNSAEKEMNLFFFSNVLNSLTFLKMCVWKKDNLFNLFKKKNKRHL